MVKSIMRQDTDRQHLRPQSCRPKNSLSGELFVSFGRKGRLHRAVQKSVSAEGVTFAHVFLMYNSNICKL